MKPKIITYSLPKKSDKRGFLVEITPYLKKPIKHQFFATIKPGQIRGDHYHKRKTEWVLVTEGEVQVFLEDIQSREINLVKLTAENPKLLEIIPNVKVSIQNKSEKLASILALFDENFNPQDPDVWVLE